jgi:NADH dehydrogenase [ubiquinone] 1 alpha subcomplex assembly factor 5
MQRSRAAANLESSRQTDYLRDEVAIRMAERLAFVSRRFDRVLDLGAGPGTLERVIADPSTPDSKLICSRLGKITLMDSSREMLYRDCELSFNKELDIDRLVLDEELVGGENRPFTDDTFDAVISSSSLHWVNDLPGTLRAIHSVLRPDGMFMGAMLGGDSLFELRTSLQLAEMERYGRVVPRLSPLADVKDMGGLLQQAKFNLLTIDVEDIVISYPSMWELLEDIKDAGESNAVKIRQPMIPRELLLGAEAIYKSMHGNENGSVPATFRIIFMIGWKEHPSQPKPLARGSAEFSLKDALANTDIGDNNQNGRT